MQDGNRSRSEEKPEYRVVSMSCYDDAHQHERQQETGNSQVSLGIV
jgi:hypothetical protein